MSLTTAKFKINLFWAKIRLVFFILLLHENICIDHKLGRDRSTNFENFFWSQKTNITLQNGWSGHSIQSILPEKSDWFFFTISVNFLGFFWEFSSDIYQIDTSEDRVYGHGYYRGDHVS